MKEHEQEQPSTQHTRANHEGWEGCTQHEHKADPMTSLVK